MHYLKIEIDKIFGAANFCNDIAWRRITKQCAGKRWATNSDRILCFAKKKSAVYFETQYLPLSEAALGRYKKRADGNLYRDSSLEWKDPNPSPNLVYEFKGKWPHTRWIWKRERMQQAWDDGIIEESSSGKWRYISPLSAGKKVDDMWDDIQPFNSLAKERVGYPTQKPVALYDRIIKASSPEGGIVLDPFCGSGTTLVAARNLGRSYIGIDANPEAVQIAESRMAETML